MNSLLRERLSRPHAAGLGEAKGYSTGARVPRGGRRPNIVTAAAPRFPPSADGPDKRTRALRNSSAGTSVDTDGQLASTGLGNDVELDPNNPPQFTEEELKMALELLERGRVDEPVTPASDPQPQPVPAPGQPTKATPVTPAAAPVAKAANPPAPAKPAHLNPSPAAPAAPKAAAAPAPGPAAAPAQAAAAPAAAPRTAPAAAAKPAAPAPAPFKPVPAAVAAQLLVRAAADSAAARTNAAPKAPAAAAAAPAAPAPARPAPGAPAPPRAAAPPAPAAAKQAAPVPPPLQSVGASAARPATAASKAGSSREEAMAAAANAKWQQQRKAAKQEVETHNPNVAAQDRHHWLVFTVPEAPVAGEEVVVYFNRNSSEALRHRPRIVCQLGFNKWELDAESSRLDLMPTSIPRDLGADFWSCRFKVPEQAYELNFVLSDLEGAFENNAGQDFTFPVAGVMTWDKWQETAIERAMQAERERVAAEKAAEEERERQRQLALAEGDRKRATDRVNEIRNGYDGMRQGAVTVLEKDTRVNFVVLPAAPRASTTIKVLYNTKATPLQWLAGEADARDLVLKYGFNGWKRPGDVTMTRSLPATLPSSCKALEDDDWWEAEVTLPRDAAVMYFVTTCRNQWDNNAAKDYRVPVGLPEEFSGEKEQWLEALHAEYLAEETKLRLQEEAEERIREEAREEKRRRAQEQVQAVQRRQLRHVLYTEPETLRAGSQVTLFYNPASTNLAGRDSIFVHCGWNRWTHRRPSVVEMRAPALGSTHFSAVIDVPVDAYKMDFVFADVAGGDGTYDNRLGLDYHLPVKGSPVKATPLHVVHIAVEMAPVAKVGGLGDVVTALGRAVKDQGHMVEVILPWYEFFWHSPLLQNMQFEKEYQWGGTNLKVTSTLVEGLRVFFINPQNGFFNTQTVYGRYDDEVRFDFFCKAALEFLLQTQRQPDILHCHDWSTAHVAQSYWEGYNQFGLWKPKVVFTIHNLEYGAKKIGEAAYFSQKFTTVSPTYAYEIEANPVVNAHLHKFMGIRNGIDPDLWDPDTCKFLPVNYNSERMEEGKAAARKLLRERLNLTQWQDKFIVGVVSRLTKQKGVHLIKHAVWRTLDRGGQFVLLGSAPDPKEQEAFNEFAQEYRSDSAAFQFKYDEPLSHLIYAAADIILVPSMFEPCGLTQMIAMRYGAVPVVRHTGGLRDTIFDVDNDKARAAWDLLGSTDWMVDGDATNGFAFEGTDNDALDYALNRAIDAWYNDKAWFRSLQKRNMEQDWSWNRPAIDYVELYFSAIKS